MIDETGTGQETSTEQTDDELLEGINAPAPERPISETGAAPAPAKAEEFEFNYQGKPVKATREQVIQWASMGYGAPNRIGELNKQLETYKTEQEKWAQVQSKYGPIDEYFTKNPDLWAHVESTWKQKQQALDPSNPVVSELQTIKSELQEIKKFKDDISTRELSKQRESEDHELDSEVKSIREAYPYLDWNSKNENGQSLEQQVLKHGVDNKIQSFRAAFRDFTFDQHLQRTELRGMEKRDKDIQKKTKLGLLGQSPTPTRGLKPAEDIKNKSYDDLWKEGLDEIQTG